jgi:hypothetical protein
MAVLEPQRLQAQQARGGDLGVEIRQRVADTLEGRQRWPKASRCAA